MLRTAAATGLSPETSSRVCRPVPGSSSRAAMTAATSARGMGTAGTGGGAGGGRPGLIGAGLGGLAGAHRGDLDEPAYPGPLGGVGHQYGGTPVDRVLAGGAAARPSTGREHHRGRPGQQDRDLLGRGSLQVADHSLGP